MSTSRAQLKERLITQIKLNLGHEFMKRWYKSEIEQQEIQILELEVENEELRENNNNQARMLSRMNGERGFIKMGFGYKT